jgi:hypothetical protein
MVVRIVESKQFSELLVRQSDIADYVDHRNRVDGVVPGNREYPRSIGHGDVFPLSSDAEASFLQRPNCVQVVDSR